VILNLEAIDLLTSVSTLMKVVAVCCAQERKIGEGGNEMSSVLVLVRGRPREGGEDVRTNLVGEFLEDEEGSE